jgi:hypothetical protein
MLVRDVPKFSFLRAMKCAAHLIKIVAASIKVSGA